MGAYSAEVLADAPSHYWRFADPGGQLARDIGSAQLDLAAYQYRATVGYTGPVSDGGSFFCTAQAAFVQLDAVLVTVPITLEAVFWQHQVLGREQKILATESSASGYNGLGIGMSAAGKPECFCSNSALVSPTTPTLQSWLHIVATHTGAQRKLYVNAINVATDGNVLATGSGGLCVGARAIDIAQYAEGCIGECAVYPSALSPARVTAHYLAIDQQFLRPVYRLFAAPNPAGGSGPTTSAEIDSILNAVRRTYVNAP